jgi:hypothetical protein
MNNDMQVQCSICGEFHVADQIEGTRNEIITRYRHDISALRARVAEVEALRVAAVGDATEAWDRVAEVETKRDMEHCELDTALARVAVLENALHQISLDSQSSMGDRYAMGRIARLALSGQPAATGEGTICSVCGGDGTAMCHAVTGVP